MFNNLCFESFKHFQTGFFMLILSVFPGT